MKKMGNIVCPQMNTENAPKVMHPTAKSVVVPKPRWDLIPPPEFPFPLPIDEDCDPPELVEDLGVGTVPV